MALSTQTMCQVFIRVWGFVTIHPSIELHRIPRRQHRQGRLQGFGIRHAGGLQHSSLGLQAGQFSIDKLQALQLRFGLVREGIEVVGLVVYGDGGHGMLRVKVINGNMNFIAARPLFIRARAIFCINYHYCPVNVVLV